MKLDNFFSKVSHQVGKSRAKLQEQGGKKLETGGKTGHTSLAKAGDTPFKGGESIRNRMEGYGKGDATVGATPKKGSPDPNSNASKLEDIRTRSEKEGHTDAIAAVNVATKAEETLDLVAASSNDPHFQQIGKKLQKELDEAIDNLKTAVESGDEAAIKEASEAILKIGQKIDRLAEQAGPLIPRGLTPQ